METIPPLISALRTPEDTDASMEAHLATIFAAERERVANAAALAELLVPVLLDELRPKLERVVVSPASIASPPPPAKPVVPKRAAASIADFIDEMIAQENSPRGPKQRAS